MYNTDFKVKYYDIEQELVLKLKTKTEEEYKENSDDEYEYSSQDVLDICNKLYRDELATVFYADDIFDDKIDKGMKYVLEKMELNPNFKNIINELKNFIYNQSLNQELTKEEQDKFIENSFMFTVFTLFNQDLFHITHKCICQQFISGIIDNELLDQLREKILSCLKYNN
jgi:hypothetical protein